MTSNYTYDPVYQLTQVQQGGTTTESYSYDAVGNRTASLGVSSYTTNASNELTATSNGRVAQALLPNLWVPHLSRFMTGGAFDSRPSLRQCTGTPPKGR